MLLVAYLGPVRRANFLQQFEVGLSIGHCRHLLIKLLVAVVVQDELIVLRPIFLLLKQENVLKGDVDSAKVPCLLEVFQCLFITLLNCVCLIFFVHVKSS